jgi:hypothetical protein
METSGRINQTFYSGVSCLFINFPFCFLFIRSQLQTVISTAYSPSETADGIILLPDDFEVVPQKREGIANGSIPILG